MISGANDKANRFLNDGDFRAIGGDACLTMNQPVRFATHHYGGALVQLLQLCQQREVKLWV